MCVLCACASLKGRYNITAAIMTISPVLTVLQSTVTIKCGTGGGLHCGRGGSFIEQRVSTCGTSTAVPER